MAHNQPDEHLKNGKFINVAVAIRYHRDLECVLVLSEEMCEATRVSIVRVARLYFKELEINEGTMEGI